MEYEPLYPHKSDYSREAEPCLPGGVLIGGILSLAAVGAILFLRALGVICWVLPVLGLILPALALFFLWGSALVMAVISLVFCILSWPARRAAATAFLVLDAAILAFFALWVLFVTGLCCGWDGALFQTLDRLCTEMLGWFFAVPSGLVLG